MGIEYAPKNNLKKAIKRKEPITHNPDSNLSKALNTLMNMEVRSFKDEEPAKRPKKPMTIRLDVDCLDAWKATGRDWQGRMNAYLRKGVGL